MNFKGSTISHMAAVHPEHYLPGALQKEEDVASYETTKFHEDPADFMFSSVPNLNSRFIFHI